MSEQQFNDLMGEVKGLREDVKAYAKETATNTADLKWVKRGVSGLGSILVLALGHMLRKLGI